MHFWNRECTSEASLAIKRAESGLCSAGLRTIVFPQARAGANFIAVRYRGAFHGKIDPTTPIGSWSVYA